VILHIKHFFGVTCYVKSKGKRDTRNEFTRKYVQERLAYRKVWKFRLSHQKHDRGDNTVGWRDTEPLCVTFGIFPPLSYDKKKQGGVCTTSQRSFPAIWWGKKGSSTKISTCRKPLKSYQTILSKFNAKTCLTITLKSSVRMIEMFSSLDKYPTLCKPNPLGPS
jgi:hypothetical protein